MTKHTVTQVEIGWSESPLYQNRYNQAQTFKSIADANNFLISIAPRKKVLGYYKTDFKITFSNGKTYQGRYDLHGLLEKQENPNGHIDLADHVLSFARCYSGRHRPSHLTEEVYQRLTNDRHVRQQYSEFLDNYEVA